MNEDTDRYLKKVDRRGDDECWPWLAYRNEKGYGTIRFMGKQRGAHRVAFFLANRRWPDNFALHRCDNTQCQNPKHIFDGTNSDNMADMVAKNRQSRLKGEAHGRSKLTDADVIAIREEYASGKSNQVELAERFGVAQARISAVILRKNWRHI